ncbi:hypothetical protein N7447_002620 [Penicillium robsamsonii]|uniref:uncharacterized protein n=1 Tax=Penicillium robsamsonii TaxID=1792511 RepID=UPI002549728C|nr:uncharacterized protein N7447_002620 [Penicillium robsamsonii]KAJ5836594.1 hypothetical protein N7447_002620 [Penicillium robsamsonii]
METICKLTDNWPVEWNAGSSGGALTLRPGLFQHYHNGVTELLPVLSVFQAKNARSSSPIVTRKSQDLIPNVSG